METAAVAAVHNRKTKGGESMKLLDEMKLSIDIETSEIEEVVKEIDQKLKELRDMKDRLNDLLAVKITLKSEKVDAEAPTKSEEL